MDTFNKLTADGIALALEIENGRARISDARAFSHRGDLPAPVAFAIWGEVSLFTAEELSHLIAAGRKLGRRKGSIRPGELRSMAARAAGDLPAYEPDDRPVSDGYGTTGRTIAVQCRFYARGGQCWGKVERVICRDPLHGRTEQDRCEGHRRLFCGKPATA